MSGSAYDIDYGYLYDRGYRGIIFDIDNTLVEHNERATEKAVALFRKLSETGFATAVVSKRLFDKWNVDKEELYDIAKENTIRLFPPEIKSLDSIIKKYISANNAEELEDYYLPKTVNNLYVLTNKEKLNGATIILYENLLSEFAKEIGVKELIILPSSIHETLIIPYTNEEMIDNKFYRQLVKEVNDTEVSREEILSYSVYKYSSKDNRVSILD